MDWGAVKSSGKVQFAMLRAGFGRYTDQVDKQFERNYAECKRLGIPVGAYWYSYATTVDEARAEMELFLRTIQGKNFEYPVCFDQEYEQSILALTNAQRTAIVKAALEALEAAGYYAGLYCSRDWINNKLIASELSAYDLWVADYTSAEPSPAVLPYGMRQVSSSNSFGVPGIPAEAGSGLDCDYAYKDYPAIIKGAGLNGWIEPEDDGGSDDSAKLQRITVGPLSSGDVATLRKLCESLSLTSMGLYKEADGVLTIGPVSSGDAWAIMRQCEALELTDMGLYHSEYVD